MSALGNYYNAQAEYYRSMTGQGAADTRLKQAQAEAIPQTTEATTNLQNVQARSIPSDSATRALAAAASANLANQQGASLMSRTPFENELSRSQAFTTRQSGLDMLAQRGALDAPTNFGSPGMFTPRPVMAPSAQPVAPSGIDMDIQSPTYGQPLQHHAEGSKDIKKGKAPTGAKKAAAHQELGPDVVPAMLSPGEAVLNREAAEHVGRGVIEHLNQIGLMKAAQKAGQGGQVGGGQPPMPMDQQAQREIQQAPTQGGGQMPMHAADGATMVWPGYADGGIIGFGNGDSNTIGQAQTANGGHMLGLGGGYDLGTVISRMAAPSGPSGDDFAQAQRNAIPTQAPATVNNLSSNGFQPAQAPSGFNTLSSTQHFATGGMVPSVNVGSMDDGSGKSPPGAAKYAPTMKPQYQNPDTAGAKSKASDKGKTMPQHQNYAQGTSEVLPIATVGAVGGMPKAQKHAKGTSKVSKPAGGKTMAPAVAPPGAVTAAPPVPVTSMPAMPGQGQMTQWGGGQ